MPARIFASVKQDTTHLHSLTELFGLQAEALRQREVEDLLALNERILELTNVLQESARERSFLLQSLGFEDNRDGMKQFLASHATPVHFEEWDQFCKQALASQTANQLSGRLLAMQQKLTGAMLNQLGRSMDVSYNHHGVESFYGAPVTLGYA